MKIFESVDDKLRGLRFIKTEDNEYAVTYERLDTKYKFVQVVALLHKASGKHIIQSYDASLGDDKGIGNTCVGLTYEEARLFLKKMKKKGWV